MLANQKAEEGEKWQILQSISSSFSLSAPQFQVTTANAWERPVVGPLSDM